MRPRRAQEDHGHAVFSDTEAGFAPAFGATNGYYLRDDGVWAPAGGGVGITYDRQNAVIDLGVNGATASKAIGTGQASGGASGGSTDTDYVIGTAPEIRRVGFYHSVVGLGTQWRSWWSTSIGFMSMASGFEASWYFGHAGSSLSQMYTGLKDMVVPDSRLLGRCMGLVCTSTLGTMRWWAGASNTTATGGASQSHPYWVSGDAAEQADTGITWAYDTIYKVSFSCAEGASSVDATLRDVTNGTSHSHTFSTNLPDANSLGTSGDAFALVPWASTTASSTSSRAWVSHVVQSRGLEAGL